MAAYAAMTFREGQVSPHIPAKAGIHPSRMFGRISALRGWREKARSLSVILGLVPSIHGTSRSAERWTLGNKAEDDIHCGRRGTLNPARPYSSPPLSVSLSSPMNFSLAVKSPISGCSTQ